MQMTLPKMDVPVTVVEWELFVPDRYRFDRFGGTAMSAELVRYAVTALTDQIGGLAETVHVVSNASNIGQNVNSNAQRGGRDERVQEAQAAAPSANVQNLQRRAAGVLPVRIDVPRAGGSYRFVKPLAIDEETTVGFRYRQR